jgi:hypothetical protein
MKARGRSLTKAASHADMDEKTARKYLKLEKLPSEVKKSHTWRTRKDPFEDIWDEAERYLKRDFSLQAKTVFDFFQRQYPGRFSDGQLRTLQRRFKTWKALNGAPKEVYFDQVYEPGEFCESDFTRMKYLGITIAGHPFEHMVYHLVLNYSNWEAISICFSESFEALSDGFQNALWQLGGVPEKHKTDRLSAAVNNMNNLKEFTQAYQALLRHYKIKGCKIQANSPNENGDVEQSHFRFKEAVSQDLILRGSRDFNTEQEYLDYLHHIAERRNAGRWERFKEEQKTLKALPRARLDATKQYRAKVSKRSTINIQSRIYSVDSRLRDEYVQVFVYANHLDVLYAQKKIDTLPRLHGKEKHHIQYRHIIDSLIRKPGAFENYRYKKDLFPTHRFRVAYDILKEQKNNGNKEYLKILHLAAKESEIKVDEALNMLLKENVDIEYEKVAKLVGAVSSDNHSIIDTQVAEVELSSYDTLLQYGGTE